MLGRLARWLRLLGYDTLYADKISDHQIVARARAKGRVVLTRDHGLVRRKGIRCLLVRSQVLEEQIREVVAAFGVPEPGAEPRCSQCNAPLVEVTPDQVRPHVPAYVLKTQTQFRRCPSCDKYYWPGSHWKDVQRTIARVLEHRKNEGRP